MLAAGDIDFFSKSEYPGYSPDLNPCENIGAIINQRVDTRIVQERGDGNYDRETLVKVLESTEYSTDLLEKILLSYGGRLDAMREANGDHTVH